MSQTPGDGKHRAQWASSLGFILAAAGSAVGLGNIWKFPGKAYNGGGASFIIIYIIIVAVIGTTAMLAEFVIGRNTQKNAVGAFRQLNKKFSWVGGLGVFTGFLIFGYYSQVGGWVIYYIVSYIVCPGRIFADPKLFFYEMLGQNGFPWLGAIICPLIFMGLVIFVITKGVEVGIEKINKILMPSLFVLLIILTIRSVTLPGAAEGLHYLLTPDFSKLNFNTVLMALGQAFFSLSLGMGIMVTYGSYLKKEENLVKNVGLICTLDTIVALMAGFMIIPAVFATGVEPGMGGGFAFVSLAGVFEKMPGGPIFGCMFYLLLFFAALTSAISIMEGTVAYVTEEKKMSRKKATAIIGVLTFIIGIFYTLSQLYASIKGIWFDFANGVTFPAFGDFLEFLTDRLLTPLGSLTFCIFVGWVWTTKKGIAEVERDGTYTFKLKKIWSVLVKFIAPLAILTILIGGMVFGLALS
ncbi:sodium-dependent transporter [Cuneatibacter sp. NSJ-177]|uniref:sodium-dependent transporter n=1 Tax=Cuneatibacter sp. NSJ-177 TaxID=2931401 RepID=UPI001FD33F9A|nr:sodium-dependent transporter [Cuneatibacter sp. NSJ-177]MCJ7835979.1 sodium-dependent transporter [Cuneatibacter sp. NSJ-177]